MPEPGGEVRVADGSQGRSRSESVSTMPAGTPRDRPEAPRKPRGSSAIPVAPAGAPRGGLPRGRAGTPRAMARVGSAIHPSTGAIALQFQRIHLT
ncbi:unnamed protein product [Sphagnum tenellum]